MTLRAASVWNGRVAKITERESGLHLRRPPHANPSQNVDAAGKPVHIHWTAVRCEDAGHSWLVSPINAVWQAIHGLDEENAIACLESAVHDNFLTVDQVQEICRAAPARLQPARPHRARP